MAVKILIPYNFSENDALSITFVGHRYKNRRDVSITLFHAHMPIPTIDPHENPIMKKVIQNTAYLRQQQEEQHQALIDAKNKLQDFGFDNAHIHSLFTPVKKDVASDIISLWKRENFDVVVLNRNPGNIVNFFTRSISKRIVRHIEGGIGVHIVN